MPPKSHWITEFHYEFRGFNVVPKGDDVIVQLKNAIKTQSNIELHNKWTYLKSIGPLSITIYHQISMRSISCIIMLSQNNVVHILAVRKIAIISILKADTITRNFKKNIKFFKFKLQTTYLMYQWVIHPNLTPNCHVIKSWLDLITIKMLSMVRCAHHSHFKWRVDSVVSLPISLNVITSIN